jgi:SAM-dependent methyltransferase
VEESDANTPSSYSHKPQAIVEFLHRFWQPEVSPEMSVLETGCNAGANLHGLKERGYNNLSAVEINPAAVREMRRAFPELQGVEVRQGALEDVLRQMPSDSVDVVFSMAVMLHIHPSSDEIFAEMARVARHYICVVEAESVTLSYIFARNYRRVFERLGYAQLRSTHITEVAFPELSSEYFGYSARLLGRAGRRRLTNETSRRSARSLAAD